MSFIRLAKYLLPFSLLLVAGSLVMFITPGPRLSIEFTGGTLMELELPKGKDAADLEKTLESYSWPDEQARQSVSLSRTRTGTVFARTINLSNEEHEALMNHVKKDIPNIAERQFTTIGPTVGATLQRRALWALAVASAAIIIYLAIAFRKVPRHLSAWTFGFAAVIALLHDLILTCGIFTILSYTTSFQMDTLFVTALLSIMGYSVSDTIVIFDRIRENLQLDGKRHDLRSIADNSLKQTLSRTLSTGMTTMIMLFFLFLLGAESIRWFMLTLIIGTVIGTYSSFFIATPLVVFWHGRKQK